HHFGQHTAVIEQNCLHHPGTHFLGSGVQDRLYRAPSYMVRTGGVTEGKASGRFVCTGSTARGSTLSTSRARSSGKACPWELMSNHSSPSSLTHVRNTAQWGEPGL